MKLLCSTVLRNYMVEETYNPIIVMPVHNISLGTIYIFKIETQ